MMQKIWENIPIWVKSFLVGFSLLVPAVIVIQFLIIENVKQRADVPVSSILVLVILWFYAKWMTGKSPFKASQKRSLLSAVALPKNLNKLWLSLLIILMVIFTASAVSAGFSFSTELSDQQEFINFFKTVPTLSAIALLGVLALTAGVVEEIVFRGFVQGMMEKRYGIIVAIIFTGVFFTLIHSLPINLLLPYFMVSFMFSIVAYNLRTVTPGIIAHAAFDFTGFMLVYFGSYIGSQEYFKTYLTANILIATISLASIILISYKMSVASFDVEKV